MMDSLVDRDVGNSLGNRVCADSLIPRPTALEVTVAPAMASICHGFCLGAVLDGLHCVGEALQVGRQAHVQRFKVIQELLRR